MNVASGISKIINKSMRLPEESFTYGKALRPSTPIKRVVNNVYGDLAEQDMYYRYEAIKSDA